MPGFSVLPDLDGWAEVTRQHRVNTPIEDVWAYVADPANRPSHLTLVSLTHPRALWAEDGSDTAVPRRMGVSVSASSARCEVTVAVAWPDRVGRRTSPLGAQARRMQATAEAVAYLDELARAVP